jgi:hypothetical protein
MNPTKCPHCGATTNPLKLSLYSTGRSFRCSRCEKQSRFDRRTLASLGGFSALLGALLQGHFRFTGLTLAGVAAVATVALIAVMWLTLTLRPVETPNA